MNDPRHLKLKKCGMRLSSFMGIEIGCWSLQVRLQTELDWILSPWVISAGEYSKLLRRLLSPTTYCGVLRPIQDWVCDKWHYAQKRWQNLFWSWGHFRGSHFGSQFPTWPIRYRNFYLAPCHHQQLSNVFTDSFFSFLKIQKNALNSDLKHISTKKRHAPVSRFASLVFFREGGRVPRKK